MDIIAEFIPLKKKLCWHVSRYIVLVVTLVDTTNTKTKTLKR